MGDCGDFVPYAHFSTQAIHVGQEPEQWASRAVVPPISLATTFKQDEPGNQIAVCTDLQRSRRSVTIDLRYQKLDTPSREIPTVD